MPSTKITVNSDGSVRVEGDFEKGLADGAEDALKLITAVADACRKMGTD